MSFNSQKGTIKVNIWTFKNTIKKMFIFRLVFDDFEIEVYLFD